MIIDNHIINEQIDKLSRHGYSIVRDDKNTITFKNVSNEITVYNNIIERTVEMSIRFNYSNKAFQIPWIYTIDTKKSLDNMGTYEMTDLLMSYIDNNYDRISDVHFCEEMNEKADKFIADNYSDIIQEQINKL